MTEKERQTRAHLLHIGKELAEKTKKLGFALAAAFAAAEIAHDYDGALEHLEAASNLFAQVATLTLHASRLLAVLIADDIVAAHREDS